jgi:hypothetical protein
VFTWFEVLTEVTTNILSYWCENLQPAIRFKLVSCFACSSTLKMEATVDFQRSTRRYVRENRTLHFVVLFCEDVSTSNNW